MEDELVGQLPDCCTLEWERWNTEAREMDRLGGNGLISVSQTVQPELKLQEAGGAEWARRPREGGELSPTKTAAVAEPRPSCASAASPGSHPSAEEKESRRPHILSCF